MAAQQRRAAAALIAALTALAALAALVTASPLPTDHDSTTTHVRAAYTQLAETGSTTATARLPYRDHPDRFVVLRHTLPAHNTQHSAHVTNNQNINGIRRTHPSTDALRTAAGDVRAVVRGDRALTNNVLLPVDVYSTVSLDPRSTTFEEAFLTPTSFIRFDDYLRDHNLDTESKFIILNRLGNFFGNMVTHSKFPRNIRDCLFINEDSLMFKTMLSSHCLGESKSHPFPVARQQFHIYGAYNSILYFTRTVLHSLFGESLPGGFEERNSADEDVHIMAEHAPSNWGEVMYRNAIGSDYRALSTVVNGIRYNTRTFGDTLYKYRTKEFFIIQRLLQLLDFSEPYFLRNLFDFFDLDSGDADDESRLSPLDLPDDLYLTRIREGSFGLNYFSKKPLAESIGITNVLSPLQFRQQYNDTVYISQLYCRQDLESLVGLSKNIADMNAYLQSMDQHEVLIPIATDFSDLEEISIYFADPDNRNATLPVLNPPNRSSLGNFFDIFSNYYTNVGYKTAMNKLRKMIKMYAVVERKGWSIDLSKPIPFNNPKPDLAFTLTPSSGNSVPILKAYRALRVALTVAEPSDNGLFYGSISETLLPADAIEEDFVKLLQSKSFSRAANHPFWDSEVINKPLIVPSKLKDFDITTTSKNIVVFSGQGDLTENGKYLVDNFDSVLKIKDLSIALNSDSYLTFDSDVVYDPRNVDNFVDMMERISKADAALLINRERLSTQENKQKLSGDLLIHVTGRKAIHFAKSVKSYPFFRDLVDVKSSYTAVELSIMSLSMALVGEFYSLSTRPEIAKGPLENVVKALQSISTAPNFEVVRRQLKFLREVKTKSPKYNQKVFISSEELEAFAEAGFTSSTECAICRSNLALDPNDEDGDAIMPTYENEDDGSSDQPEASFIHTCRNGYHADCLQQWTKSHKSCPMCRSSITNM